jgi:hypothetical protein
MAKKLTQEDQTYLDKIKADLEADLQREIPHEDVLKWMKEAKAVKIDTLPEFIKRVHDEIPVSYGNICHKIAIAAIAAAYSFENSEQGGITGFQSGCIMWEFVCAWTGDYDPQRLVHYHDMLYPQMLYKFTSISKETWEWLQKEAKKNLEDTTRGYEMAPEVTAHMQSIADGKVPKGFEIRD